MDFNKRQPIYIQLMDDIKMNVLNGSLKPGDKLQSIRDYAQEMMVNPNTAQKAYAELESQEYIFSKRGIGYFVNEDGKQLKKIRTEYLDKQVGDFISRLDDLNFSRKEITDKLKEKL